MVDLDNDIEIKKLDKSNLYGSVEELSKQCVHAFEDASKINVPESYRNINKVLMTGMGGSGLGARIIESVYGLNLKYPLIRLNDYKLPNWVDEKTLVICSTFSGTTEETIENAEESQKRNIKWMAISSGSQLIDLAKKYKVPYYQINPTYNPSKQPRMAIGYSVVGQLVMVSETGLINFSKKDIDSSIKAMKEVVSKSNMSVKTESNQAKQMAKKFFQKKVVYVAARHLVGAAHTSKNQMNENSKNFSAIFDIPELNHHLMEGLINPSSNKEDLMFLFIESDLYPERIRKRFEITKRVVEKNNVRIISYKTSAKDHLSQVFEFVQFGGYVNFYLAMLYGLDASPIPWVDYFKTELGQPLGQWK